MLGSKGTKKVGFTDFIIVLFIIGMVGLIGYNGVTKYQPAVVHAEAVQEQKRLAQDEKEKAYMDKLEKYYEEYQQLHIVTSFEREKIRIMEEYLVECGGEGGYLQGRANDFWNVCKFEDINLDPLLLWSISIQETGAGHSDAIKNLQNVGGIFAGNKLRSYYGSIYRGITDMAVNLRWSGFYDTVEGLYTNQVTNTTIEQLGAIYCPVGATNDPNGLNKHWVPNVKKHYLELLYRCETIYNGKE